MIANKGQGVELLVDSLKQFKGVPLNWTGLVLGPEGSSKRIKGVPLNWTGLLPACTPTTGLVQFRPPGRPSELDSRTSCSWLIFVPVQRKGLNFLRSSPTQSRGVSPNQTRLLSPRPTTTGSIVVCCNEIGTPYRRRNRGTLKQSSLVQTRY